MLIPDLINLISSFECDNWSTNKYSCKNCPYGYQYWDNHGDYGFWSCDQEKQMEDALFYLKLYQYLIEDEKDD